MVQQKSRIKRIAPIVLFFLLFSAGIFISLFMNRPVGVDELWEREYKNRNLEGKTVVVRGDILFEPFSDFRFNAVYIVDSETSMNLRTPSFAFWFGVGIDGVSCDMDYGENLMTCGPFDPTQGTVYEFKGTIHVDQIGKKEIMWLSDIDFENSRQLANGQWQPIPMGEFEISLENN